MNLEPIKQIQDKTTDRMETPVKQEYTLKDKVIIKPNQKLYSMNMISLEVREVKVKRTIEVDLNGDTHGKGKTGYDPECMYYGAYNLKQAEKHFKKILDKREVSTVTMPVFNNKIDIF